MAVFQFDVRDADNYLTSGGLGEMIGAALSALQAEFPTVQISTDVAMALLLLADEGMKARSVRAESIEQ